MIETNLEGALDALEASLIAKAHKLGEARARRLKRGSDPTVWRDARTIWPLFVQE